MLKAWTGEPFEHRGTTVKVTPRPLQQPHPLVLVGGSTEIAARRAARLHLPFMPAIGDPALAELYQSECEKEGYEEGWVLLPSGPGFLHVAEDPEKAWAQILPHALYDAQTYASWQKPGMRSAVTTYAATPEELKASGVYAVVTPEECVDLAEKAGPMASLVFHPLMGGMSPELGWESLELFASKVLPRIQ
jgi:alkanesulfonate monooxygenase SsuD/methylene tetrahydromethanopterin reductase-like flavin-dependent oxidoreductase (luciferase family)